MSLFLFKHFSSSDLQNIHLLRFFYRAVWLDLEYYAYIILQFSFHVLPVFLDHEGLLN